MIFASIYPLYLNRLEKNGRTKEELNQVIEWFTSQIPDTKMNNYWAWYHVMEHQANHMGQIRLILKRTEN